MLIFILPSLVNSKVLPDGISSPAFASSHVPTILSALPDLEHADRQRSAHIVQTNPRVLISNLPCEIIAAGSQPRTCGGCCRENSPGGREKSARKRTPGWESPDPAIAEQGNKKSDLSPAVRERATIDQCRGPSGPVGRRRPCPRSARRGLPRQGA